MIFPELISQLNSASGQDKEYTDFIADKSVCIVGPAELDVRDGNKIDSYDVIVRINDAVYNLPFSKQDQERYGSRTDVLYCAGPIPQNDSFVSCIQHIRPAYIVQKYLDDPTTSFFPMLSAKYKELVRSSNMPRVVPANPILFGVLQKHLSIIAKTEVKSARTGFFAICDLIAARPSRLYITGFSFYHGGGHVFGARDPSPGGILAPVNTNHNSISELLLFKELLARHRFISYDNLLSRVLDKYA